MGDRRRARRRVLRRRRRRTTGCARFSRSATPKQSIYSFQRADPQAFVDMRRYFEERVIAMQAALGRGAAGDLVPRRRAAAARGRCGVPAGRGGRRGGARRRPDPPCRRLSPAMPDWSSCGRRCRPIPMSRRTAAMQPARAAPLEPRTRLARAIAATIAGWLDGGERLEPRGRALQAGDVIVLVRRRNAFVGDLLRALKAARRAGRRRRPPRAGRANSRCRIWSRSATSCCCRRTI